MRIALKINGEPREADVWGGESLLTALRDRLGLPGSKNACEQGECGSCSVLLDGELVCSCLVLAAQADGHEVVTVEGLARDGDLHPVQRQRLPESASRISSSVGLALCWRRSAAATTSPGVQKPHWTAPASTNAAWTSVRLPSALIPSTVTIG